MAGATARNMQMVNEALKVNQPINESINQSINQIKSNQIKSINQSIKSINQINQSINSFENLAGASRHEDQCRTAKPGLGITLHSVQ